jgi:cytoskeletal protein CcmA (bactofilin family)
MFGRKNTEDASPETTQNEENISLNLRPASEQSASRSAAPTIARRMVDIPSSNSRRPSSGSDADRRLTVGKGLSLAGEITSCDILVVEGKVEAKLSDGKLLEITESGQFRGSVEIENADIAGRYDGQLIVHGRLTIRATGRISGMVKYGELEVNAGGQIIGELQVAGAAAAQAGNNSFKSAAKFTSLSDDEATSEEAKTERKSA